MINRVLNNLLISTKRKFIVHKTFELITFDDENYELLLRK